MIKHDSSERQIILRPYMPQEEITNMMPAQVDIADILVYTDKSKKRLFPNGCLAEAIGPMRCLAYAILEFLKAFEITGIQKKENLEQNSITIIYHEPAK